VIRVAFINDGLEDAPKINSQSVNTWENWEFKDSFMCFIFAAVIESFEKSKTCKMGFQIRNQSLVTFYTSSDNSFKIVMLFSHNNSELFDELTISLIKSGYSSGQSCFKIWTRIRFKRDKYTLSFFILSSLVQIPTILETIKFLIPPRWSGGIIFHLVAIA